MIKYIYIKEEKGWLEPLLTGLGAKPPRSCKMGVVGLRLGGFRQPQRLILFIYLFFNWPFKISQSWFVETTSSQTRMAQPPNFATSRWSNYPKWATPFCSKHFSFFDIPCFLFLPFETLHVWKYLDWYYNFYYNLLTKLYDIS